MPNFPLDPKGCVVGYGWRPLRLLDPLQKGWDVYDLQCKLTHVGHVLNPDGFFGTITRGAVMAFQATVSPAAGPIDGIAGVRTQVVLGQKAALAGNMPERVLGQMEKESSFLCGIYTPQYSNGSQDTGPIQMNNKYHPDLNGNFDVRVAVPFLVKTIREQHDRYAAKGVKDRRAWEAAQGYWNNQVYANAYAKGEVVPDSFLDYIHDVTLYA